MNRVLVIGLFFGLLCLEGVCQSSKSFRVPTVPKNRPLFRADFQMFQNELYYLSPGANELLVFDWNTASLARTISLNRSGVGIRGFRVLSHDSIIVFSEYYKKSFSLMNSEGKPLGLFRMVDPDHEYPAQDGAIAYRGEVVARLGDRLLLSKGVFRQEALKTSSCVALVDLSSKSSKILDSFIDDDGLSNVPLQGWRATANVVPLPKDKFLITYPFVDYGFSFDIKTQEVGRLELGSADLLYRLLDLDPNDKSSLLFENLILNEKRNLIYRVIRLPVDESIVSSYRSGYIDRLPLPGYAIVVYDLEFQPLKYALVSLESHRVDAGLIMGTDELWCLKTIGWRDGILEFEKPVFRPIR